MVTSSTSNVRERIVPNSLWNKIECSMARSTSLVCSRSRTFLPAASDPFSLFLLRHEAQGGGRKDAH